MNQSERRIAAPTFSDSGAVNSAAIAQEALHRARQNEIHDPGLAAAIMKAALRTIAGEWL